MMSKIHDELLLECPAREEHLKRLKASTNCTQFQPLPKEGGKTPKIIEGFDHVEMARRWKVYFNSEG